MNNNALQKQLRNVINVTFISVDQNINYSLSCNKDDKFYMIEERLYEKYPKYLEEENYFIANGIKINKFKTIEQNKIKNGDSIVLKKIDDD